MEKNSLTEGPIFRALFVFSLPIIITNTINILFHSADVAVLAFFAGGDDVAAVGACGALISLMVSLFTSLATGANVLISKRVGAKDEHGTKRAVGTALSIGLLSGIFLMIVSLVFARRFLVLMNCQPDVLDSATLYMKIYFLGSPIMMVNNFAIAALRAAGDSRRPMIYSMLSGVVNVGLNVLLVAACGLEVVGVAIATVVSAGISLVLVLIRLFGSDGHCRAEWKSLRINVDDLFEIVRVGVPICLCCLSFFLANVVLSSAVNSVDTDFMTANTIAGQIDVIVYTVGSAIASAVSVMVAQNYGACNLDRIRRTMRVGIVYVSVFSFALGSVFAFFAEPVLGILSDDANVIALAKGRLIFLCLTYFVTSIMELFSFALCAVKRQGSTIFVGAVCGLGIRCLWRYLAWPLNPTLAMLYACFNVSAAVAIVIYLFVYRGALKSMHREMESDVAKRLVTV